MGSVKKFGTIPPGFFREHIAALLVVRDSVSVRRKKPGPIHLTFSPLPRGRGLWAGAGATQLHAHRDMTRAQCHWSPRALGQSRQGTSAILNGTIDALHYVGQDFLL